MDADETSGAATAWTPAPWKWDAASTGPDCYWGIGASDGRTVIDGGRIDGDMDVSPADAVLIALAPEMAAAILENDHAYAVCRSLGEVHDKLRAIGGDR